MVVKRETTHDELADERIIALETRIAYQDHLLASLDEVLREFAGRVEKLERALRELRATVVGMPEASPSSHLPPHY